MTRLPRPLAALALLALALAAPATPAGAQAVPQAAAPSPASPKIPPIEYRLRLGDPASHMLEVSIRASATAGGPTDFQIPAWSPGRYVIYDFARNVQQVSARDNGGPLEVVKIDKQTWRVDATEGTEVTLNYRVFADDLSGTFSEFDERHANVNGPSVYMYVVGRKAEPVRLNIEAPPGWRAINGLAEEPGQVAFSAPNYDVLVDNPTEISPALDVRSFKLDGREYRVMTHQIGDREDPTRYVTDVARIVRAESAIMGPPDLERYTFLVHFAPDFVGGDGMEHLYSTEIVRTEELGEQKAYDGLLAVTAHEFFHTWNMKRLRPAELGPWDYTRENYTTSLWIGEGLTSYYGDIVLARAGLWSEERFLRALATQIAFLESSPGRRLMSLEQSSFDTWLYIAVQGRQRGNERGASINYYNKGEVVGALLDLEIRHRTSSARSLDDVFRLLYKRFYTDAPAATYYFKGRGYRGPDFLAAVNEVSGSDFSDFFKRYVSGTEDLDYRTAFGYAGLAFERERNEIEIKARQDATPEQRAFRRAWITGQ